MGCQALPTRYYRYYRFFRNILFNAREIFLPRSREKKIPYTELVCRRQKPVVAVVRHKN
jgi:hypothetical protein